MTGTLPVTAKELLAELRPWNPAPLPGGGLEYDAGTPADLDALTELLATGVAALLTGRRWFGLPANGRAVVIDPARRVPDKVKLLAAEGDAGWNRIPAYIPVRLPHLFEPAGRPGRQAART